MYTVSTGNRSVFLRDISQAQLTSVLKWYNDVENYMFATGIDKPVTWQEFAERYRNSVNNADEFFIGIFPASRRELMIGAIKGKICPEDTAWINSIVIDRDFQNRGYGEAAINLLSSNLHIIRGIRSLYISVAEENLKGKLFWIRQGFKEIRRMEQHLFLMGCFHNVLILHKKLV